jgi:hypothetical protein
MKSFIGKYKSAIIGVLSGFDRLMFRGTLRRISSVAGLSTYLQYHKILLKDFAPWAENLTMGVRSASEQVAREAGRPIHYITSPSVDKEKFAREIAKKDKIDNGLICLLKAVEPCMAFDVRKDREQKKLKLVARERKCLWIYQYMIHPELGFMHARIQTWLPFTIKMCINGREWLSVQMDKEHIGYVRKNNCFVDVENTVRAQQLLDSQLKTNWAVLLDSIQTMINPVHAAMFSHYPMSYYWSADESEWATDILFKSSQELSHLYPSLIKYGMNVLDSNDVMRFLSRSPADAKGVNPRFQGQIVSDVKKRSEGVRIKHRINRNHIKMYNKEGSVLRVETTINDPREFKVYRRANDDPEKPYSWQKLRKGVADLHRRSHLSQACNNRYLEAMSCVDIDTTVDQQLKPICRRVESGKKTYRALNPWSNFDATILKAISPGKYALAGFRNRDLLAALYPQAGKLNNKERKRLSAKISRTLRLLRAHGLIKKINKTHRYQLTQRGREVTTAFITVNDCKINDLYKNVA